MSDTSHERAEVVIVGAGLAGLAAAVELGTRAITLERDFRPGGLVKTDELDPGYWFDKVLHLLYCPDGETEAFVRDLLGERLLPCRPEAWVCTGAGTVRYPFQMHLGSLPYETVVQCLTDLARNRFGQPTRGRENFEQLLRETFGDTMCELFLLPYNRKMWKCPLANLAPSGFQWTITPPIFEDVLRGALQPDRRFNAYNSSGWYPRPASDAGLRGMEVLSNALATRIPTLRLGYIVDNIDLTQRRLHCSAGGRRVSFEYERAVACTLPLPQLMRILHPVPSRLLDLAAKLKWNRVVMAAYSIRGPRPSDQGHWRYYSDESLLFNRLIYMHEFDPCAAPADGWGLMAEITEPSGWPQRAPQQLLTECLSHIRHAGAMGSDCQVVGQHCWTVDPAYVVLTAESQRVVEEISQFLRGNSIEPLGRYGRWEYSSMGQVIRDGRRWAKQLAKSTFEASC
jgi:protoporphyrinogen oxidase